MTLRLPIGRSIAGAVGLFLLWQSVGLASSFASGQHAGAGGYIVLAGALIGVLLVLSWGSIRGRTSAGWMVLLGGILGSWSPMLASAAWTKLASANPMPFGDVMTFWLVWATGAILSISAPVGLWLVWLAVRPIRVSARRAA